MANEKPNLSYSDFYTFNSNPTATVNPAKVGVVWINNKDKKIFICTDNTLNKNKWEETPNMALLEGKVEDALKELEDMSQEIRTYASGLEYTKQILIGNKTYSWKYDVELELSPELYTGQMPDRFGGAMAMEMQFYINSKYHPVAYCTLGNNWGIHTYTELYVNKGYIFQPHLYTHRASFGTPFIANYGRYQNWNGRYTKLYSGNYNPLARYYHFALGLTSSDHVDLENISEIRTSPYSCNYLNRGILAINGISNYGIPISAVNYVGVSIPWYIYYGGETSLTDYWPKVVSPAKIDKDILIRYKMMYTGVPYTIKLKAGETFRFRVRTLRYNGGWSGWLSSSYLPVGYMAPKQVSYIN